jgi:hypothetical protein
MHKLLLFFIAYFRLDYLFESLKGLMAELVLNFDDLIFELR